MILKSMLAVLAASMTAALLAVFATAGTTPGSASLLIRHQTRGCHAWALNGGPLKATQSVTLRRGGWLEVTNDDVMPHALVKVSGPAVRMVNLRTGNMGLGMRGPSAVGAMRHMGASTKVFFSKVGVYRFTTKAGEDYMPGVKTVGEDNVLRVKVTVS